MVNDQTRTHLVCMCVHAQSLPLTRNIEVDPGRSLVYQLFLLILHSTNQKNTSEIRASEDSLKNQGGPQSSPSLFSLQSHGSMGWLKGKSKPETIDFPMKYRSFL